MKLRTSKKLSIGLGLLLLAVIVVVPILFSEVRSFILFKLAPAYARDAHFLRLTGNDRVVYLLGTIHTAHCTSEAYSLWHLDAVIDHLRPDLVLVESRPQELARDNWGDGPVEMPFASLTARRLGIAVDGIDWWDKSGSRPGTSNPEREERIFQNTLQRLHGHRTALVLVGYSHVSELRDRLAQVGYADARFGREEKQALFSTTGRQVTFPPGLKHYLRKYVDAERKELEQETDPAWKRAMEANLIVRQEMIDLIDKVGERPSPPARRAGPHKRSATHGKIGARQPTPSPPGA
jgi:hypothetical protein